MGTLKRRIIESMEPKEEPPRGHMKDLDRRIRQGGDDAIAAVGELMPRWIPVTERLPEKGVPVIGWFPGAMQSFECALNEHDGVWCEWGTGIYLYENERPTHWMPFPDPPAW